MGEKVFLGGSAALAKEIFADTEVTANWVLDICSCMELLHMNIDRSTIAEWHRLRIRTLYPVAIDTFDHLYSQCSDKPEAVKEEIDHLATFFGHLKDTGITGSSVSGEAVLDDVDSLTNDVLAHRERLENELTSEASQADADAAQRLRGAFAMLEEGLNETGTERGTLLRQARRIFDDLAVDPRFEGSPVIWVRKAWITWRLSESTEEALRDLEVALKRGVQIKKPSTMLAARMMAYLLHSQGNTAEAYKWASMPFVLESSPEACIECFTYAIKLGKHKDAESQFENAIKRRPVSMLIAFASDKASELGTGVLDRVARLQQRLRQEARREISAWSEVTDRIAAAEKTAGQTGWVPAEITETQQQAAEAINSASLLSAKYFSSFAVHNADGVTNKATQALEAEVAIRATAVAGAQAGVDAAWSIREARVDAAFQHQEAELFLAREKEVKTWKDGEKAQKGCAWGMSLGCGAMSLFVAFSFIMSMRGVIIGVGSTIGQLSLLASILPVAVGALVQVTHHLKQAGLNSEVQAKIKAAKDEYDKAVEEADAIYNATIAVKREELEKAEKELLELSSAQAALAAIIAEKEAA